MIIIIITLNTFLDTSEDQQYPTIVQDAGWE